MATALPQDRFALIRAEAATASETLAGAVADGLLDDPKRLPCRYLYDAEGSRLFEEICELPDYYLTRAEERILEQRAGEIAKQVPPPVALVELGSGSARKTRPLIEALLGCQDGLVYAPVDISRSALVESARSLLGDHDDLHILAVEGEYAPALERLDGSTAANRLILWLGSSIGNLGREDARRFLRSLRDAMHSDERLLVGIDLRKERGRLERAYDDPDGVTARFNLNLLSRINRELGGAFDEEAFRHVAEVDEEVGRVEMYLESRRDQTVPISALGIEVRFRRGERIHTENSYKYAPGEIDALGRGAGLRCQARWTDPDGDFSLNLFAPA